MVYNEDNMINKKIIIAVVGLYSSGKDTVAHYLEKRGFRHLSLSDILREVALKRDIYKSRDDLIKLGNKLRKKYGRGYLAKLLKKKAEKSQFKNIVVTSVRNLGEVSELRKGSDFFLLQVKAPIKLRYQRAKKRGKIDDKVSFNRFKSQENFERKGSGYQQQLDKVIDLADYTILNNGTAKTLFKKIDKILRLINKKRNG
jgi:dephospho-CoA kinase